MTHRWMNVVLHADQLDRDPSEVLLLLLATSAVVLVVHWNHRSGYL